MIPGGGVNISSHVGADHVEVYNSSTSPYPPTTLNWLSGASNMDTNPSTEYDIDIFGSSKMEMFGGSFVDDDIYTWDMSTLTVWGGYIDDDIEADHGSSVQVYGGRIDDEIQAWGASRVDVYAGSIGDDIESYIVSEVHVYGGTVDDAFLAYHGSTIKIYGPNFNYGFGVIGDSTGQLIGTLRDGTHIDNLFEQYDDATIELVYAPVPAPGAMMLGMVGLVMLKRLRRHV